MGLEASNFSIPMSSPYFGSQYGGYPNSDEQAKKIARMNALASIGQNYGGVSSGGGTISGALGGAGTGAALGTAIAPGVGTAIGAGIGAIVGGVGAGIQGAKEEKRLKEQAQLDKRKVDLYEQEMKNDQFNTERSAGLEGLKYLAGMRSNAIQSRNRSLFKNDLMRVLGR